MSRQEAGTVHGETNKRRPVVEVRGLRKRFGDVEAVRGVDLEVRAGEIFAFLGPNGAGKTTTIEILAGFRRPTTGEIRVLGVDPAHAGPAWRNRVGIVLQESNPEPGLTVRQALQLYAGYYDHPMRIDDVIAMVGLERQGNTSGERLSGGQRRRLDVALALVGDPELLFLDEPTTGFDPGARRDAWDVVEGLRSSGTTVFLTTHSMEEAEHLADRVAVMAAGAIVAEGPPGSLGGRDRMRATIRFTLPPSETVAGLPDPVQSLAESRAGGVVAIRTEAPLRHVRLIADWADARGVDLPDLEITRPTLEDVYLELTHQRKEES
jgi:ABC-2 type transport system ATP-binding protein